MPYFIGHPPARETSQDGQYESGVRERVNLTPMPGRPAGHPAGGKSPNVTIDLGTVFFDDRSSNFLEQNTTRNHRFGARI